MNEKCFYDGHCHLFDASGDIISLGYGMNENIVVGFIDVRPQYFNRKVNYVQLYNNFIANQREIIEKQCILLAAGETAEQMIRIYQNHPDIIKGFGEIKCYEKCAGIGINNKNLIEVRKLCDYMSDWNMKMPIYIHYTLTRDEYIQNFEKLLIDYPNIPIVLCHGGLEDESEVWEKDIYNNHEIWNEVKRLAKKYHNLYIDISFTGMIYLNDHPEEIEYLPANRVILGRDLNPFVYKERRSKVYYYNGLFNNLYNFVDNGRNIRKLFNILYQR